MIPVGVENTGVEDVILPLYVPARSGVCRARTAAYWVIDERYVK